jgi:hypothetical protein
MFKNIREALMDDQEAIKRAERFAKHDAMFKAPPVGHEFYGNQHSDGEGGGDSNGAVDRDKEERKQVSTKISEKVSAAEKTAAAKESTADKLAAGIKDGDDKAMDAAAKAYQQASFAVLDVKEAMKPFTSTQEVSMKDYNAVEQKSKDLYAKYKSLTQQAKNARYTRANKSDTSDMSKRSDGSNQHVSKGSLKNLVDHLQNDGRAAEFADSFEPTPDLLNTVMRVYKGAQTELINKGFLGRINSVSSTDQTMEYQHMFDGRVASLSASWNRNAPAVKLSIKNRG